jgi:Brp/Blh family beta-carotene 15,15'-monooxygenase
MIDGQPRPGARILRDVDRRGHVVSLSAVWSRRLLAAALLGFAGVTLLAGTAPAALVLAAAAAGLVAGLPHGAVDHVLVSRTTGRSLPAVTAGYGAAAALVWVLLHWGGPGAQWSVIVLSLVHFGLGETEVWRATSGWHPAPATTAALALAGTGALVLPLARAGDELERVANAFSPAVAVVVTAAPARLSLAAVWVAAALVATLAALRAGRPRIATDILLIGAAGALLPPLAAFALWFGGWHALRHTGRLLTTEPRCAALVDSGRTGDAVRHLARLAGLPSAVALVSVLVLVGLTVGAPEPEAALAEVLRILLALTVPHMLVVLWLDRRRRPGGTGPGRVSRTARPPGVPPRAGPA